MLRVGVDAFGFLKNVFGGRVVVSVPAATTVEALLRHLGDRYPEFASLAYRDGELTDAFQVLVGEQLLELVGGMSRVLADGDEIVLLPPFEGG